MDRPDQQTVSESIASVQTRCGACSGMILTPINRPHANTLCPKCGAVSELTLFPAVWMSTERNRGNTQPVFGDETSCFFHPTNQAIVPCDQCGRFLCALCDVEMQSLHLCPECLQRNVNTERIETLINRRTRFDSIALYLAFLPMLLFYLTIVTAPIALFIAIRYWKAPGSIVNRIRWRMPLAAAISTLQIAMWLILLIIFIGAIRENL